MPHCCSVHGLALSPECCQLLHCKRTKYVQGMDMTSVTRRKKPLTEGVSNSVLMTCVHTRAWQALLSTPDRSPILLTLPRQLGASVDSEPAP